MRQAPRRFGSPTAPQSRVSSAFRRAHRSRSCLNSSPVAAAEKSRQNPTAGLGNDQLARRIPAPPIYAMTCPPHEVSYSTMEKLQYGGSQAQESDRPASTPSFRGGPTPPPFTSPLLRAVRVYAGF